MANVLIPIPNQDFDPTEVAVPWQHVRAAGHTLMFATPDAHPGRADELMLTGCGLDPWGFVPGLAQVKLVGLVLRANGQARAAYRELECDSAFQKPLAYAALRVADYDALLLPGGHRARGMRAYLESTRLRELVGEFFDAGKPVGAICHGVLLAANSVSKRTGRSVLHGRKTTALTWALERSGWQLARVSRFWDPDYYRTYSEHAGQAPGARSVEAEVKQVLASAADFLDVPASEPQRRRKQAGLYRDSASDERPAFVVRDRNYVSARWPGDANTFAKTLLQVIAEATPTAHARTR